MANSRNASSNKGQPDALRDRVACGLPAALHPGMQLLLGLSGGLDSVVLLTLLAELAPGRFSLCALHVNHGISPNAARWAQFCGGLCEGLRVPLSIEAVHLERVRQLGTEAAAREARYAAFNRHAADFLVLAHHRDDQAETLLLQLLRGSGAPGLAGMGMVVDVPSGLSRVPVLRPLLEVSRSDIEAFARSRGLAWVEDESNTDTSLDRNYVRREVLPLVERRFPSARATIARSASHFAEAAGLLHELGCMDLERCRKGEGWEVAALQALGAARARNALRALCRSAGVRVPGAAQLAEWWRQLERSRKDARLRIDLGACSFRRYRGTLFLEARRPRSSTSFRAAWQGERSLCLPQLGGVLAFNAVQGAGVSLEKLNRAPVTVRLREGGERLQPDVRRPRRTLKNLLQEQGVPPWRRDRLPLVYCGEHLVAVPGVGEESGWRAGPGEAGVVLRWQLVETKD